MQVLNILLFVSLMQCVITAANMRRIVQLIKEMPSMQCCEPEAFQHHYISAGGQLQLWNNSWSLAIIGERAFLDDVCLQPNGLPVSRLCRRNEQTKIAEWENIENWAPVHCLRETRQSIITLDLNTLHQEIEEGKRLGPDTGSKERQEVADLVYQLISQPQRTLLPADVALTSRIMKPLTRATKDIQLTKNLLHVMNFFMSSDEKVLRLSAEVNATNSMLDTFEIYMDSLSTEYVSTNRCSMPAEIISSNTTTAVQTIDALNLGVRAEIAEKLSVFFLNPGCANISGIAIYKKNASSKWELIKGPQFRYRFLYLNESETALLEENDLMAATFVPLTLWQKISDIHKTALLVIKVYYNDVLFVDPNLERSRKPFSKILSISIPGFTGEFPEWLPFVLRNSYIPSGDEESHDAGCACWNYSSWSSAGVQTNAEDTRHNALILCGTKHLTQFGFLVGGSYRQTDLTGNIIITPLAQQALDIISLVGCSLSLLGLLGIWLTAALFPKWRSNVQKKVLLNLCVALTLQMVLFLFVNTDSMAEYLASQPNMTWTCVMLGAMMQYSTLVLFMWMLSVAYIQFQRFVTVMGDTRPSHYVLKSAIMAWGLPLIPTLIAALVAPQSYIPTQYQLSTNSGVCYPSGGALIYGVILPVACIASINLYIFVYVFYNVHTSLRHPLQRTERKKVKTQVKLYAFLFFVLGLPWIFGIFAFVGAGIVFSYLFCLTATLQGFVLFIYYVIFNSVARTEWRNFFCPSRKRKSKQGSKETNTIMLTTSTRIER